MAVLTRSPTRSRYEHDQPGGSEHAQHPEGDRPRGQGVQARDEARLGGEPAASQRGLHHRHERRGARLRPGREPPVPLRRPAPHAPVRRSATGQPQDALLDRAPGAQLPGFRVDLGLAQAQRRALGQVHRPDAPGAHGRAGRPGLRAGVQARAVAEDRASRLHAR